MKTNLAYRIEGIQPILMVKDMRLTRAFYVDKLGFTEADWGTDIFTSMTRDGGSIYFCQGYQGNPGTWVWLGFEGDIFDLFNKLKSSGVKIRSAPKNFSWALEMHVEDPDGHVIRFGTDPDQSKPFVDSSFSVTPSL